MTSSSPEEHGKNMTTTSVKLNADKLTVGYFDHIISADGLKPDPTKVKTIQEIPPPVDKKELQTTLGMINYLAKFTPQLSETTKPIRDLKDDSRVPVGPASARRP